MSPSSLRILAGSGRSGTTWLQDVLCEANNLSAVFEPLHPAALKRARPLARKYAGYDDSWPELQAFWQEVIQHRYSKIWSIYRVRPDRLRPSSDAFKSLTGLKKYLAHWLRLYANRKMYSATEALNGSLIKVIRANLMLPFLLKNTDAKVVFVLRHPAAVVESQLRLGRDWNAQRIAAQYDNDIRLHRRLGHSWPSLVKQMKSDTEVFTLIWCLENLIPIEDLQGNERVQFLYYEKLADNEEGSWRRLLNGFGLDQMPSETLKKIPSQQATEKLHKNVTKSRDIDAPLKRLKPQQRDEIQRVLKMFEVPMYDVSSIRPRHDNVEIISSWQGAAQSSGDLK